jgi:hypothetical protein
VSQSKVDYRSEPGVREAASEFRKKHGALDWSASVDDLIEAHGYGQDRYLARAPTGFGAKLRDAIERVGKKVKALVSVRDQVILLSTDLHDSKEPFAKAHELGHAVLDWHREILYVCDEHDLKHSTQLQMEFEANTFASELLLPKDLLQKYYDKFETSMETVLLIKEHARTSIEMTVYAYVRHHPRVCGVAVLEDVKDENGEVVAVRLAGKSLSTPAVRTRKASISLLQNGQEFKKGHVAFEHAKKQRQVMNAEIHIGKKVEGNHCNASIFNTGYKTFCLLTPRDP